MNDLSHDFTPEQKAALDLIKSMDAHGAQFVKEAYERKLNSGNGRLPGDLPDPWRAYTLADAFQERPPLKHVVGKLFELPSLNIAYGAPGTLKSFLLQDLAICVAGGLEWLTPAPWKAAGGAGMQTRQLPTMWLDFDNGTRRTHNRFEALARARKLPVDTPLTYFSMPNPWLSATKPESIGMLTNRIKAAGAQLVIIDNLGNVSGDADENSAEMGVVMSQFRQLAEETGAAVVLIHHQRKSNGLTGRAGDSLRGHSSIEAALDLALLIEREPYAENITIRATKVRGAEILPFGAHFTYTLKDDGDLLEARFYGLDADDNESDAAIRREILAALTGDVKLNKKDLTAEVKKTLEKIGQNRIRTMIDRMAAEKQIKVTAGERTERLYSL